MRAWAVFVAAALVGACAYQAVVTATDLKRQKAEVDAAIKPLFDARQAEEARLDLSKPETDAEIDRIVTRQRAAEAAVLQQLATQGNTEAMFRLADLLRDGQEPEVIRRWYALTTAASAHGHPGSDDELVRWYWHQKGNGSIAAVQANRRIALDHARKAADEGSFYAINRVATYVSGNVHQYPGSVDLGRRIFELCANADDDVCQDRLMTSDYTYPEPPAQAYLWLSRLAERHPERFESRRAHLWSAMTAAQRAQATDRQRAWRPRPWVSLRHEWDRLAIDVMRQGAASTGEDSLCTTSKPWCRGQALAER